MKGVKWCYWMFLLSMRMQLQMIPEKVEEIYLRQDGSIYLGEQVIELKQISSKRRTAIEYINAFPIFCGNSKRFMRIS
jgi:hypothetical protein